MKKNIILMVGILLTATFTANAKMDPSTYTVPVSSEFKQTTDYKWTPLHWAVRHGDIKEIQSLIDRSSQLEDKDVLNRTPLHIAVLSGHYEAAKLLIQHGADVNAKDRWGITPLHRANLVEENRKWDRSNIKTLISEAGGN